MNIKVSNHSKDQNTETYKVAVYESDLEEAMGDALIRLNVTVDATNQGLVEPTFSSPKMKGLTAQQREEILEELQAIVRCKKLIDNLIVTNDV